MKKDRGCIGLLSDWKFENEIPIQKLRSMVANTLAQNLDKAKNLIKIWWSTIDTAALKTYNYYTTKESFQLDQSDNIIYVFVGDGTCLKMPDNFSINEYINYFESRGFGVAKIPDFQYRDTYYLRISWEEKE